MKYNSITEFIIDGQQYFICPEYLFNRGSANKISNAHFIDAEIVGEVSINSKKYVVVQQKKHVHENSDEKLKSSVDILTKRELQIVMLVAEGKVNKQVADQLKISEWTVSIHLRRIFAKLGIDSRAAMIYRCAKLIEQLKHEK